MKAREIILPVVTVFVVSCLGLTWQKSSSRKVSDTSRSTKVSAELDDKTDDERNVAQFYRDSPILVKGRVMKVKTMGHARSVELGTDTFTGKVICEFPAAHNDLIDKMQPGQAVVVKGICAGLLPDVVLIQCIIFE